MFKVLFLGELTGKPGITCLKKGLEALKKKYEADYTIINAEGMTGGFGIGKVHAMTLPKMGIDLATGGEKLFYKVDMVEFLPKCGFVLRPYNFPMQCPGRGMKTVTIKDRKVIICNIMGNSDFPKLAIQNAFQSADYIAKKAKEENAILLVQFHAATTAEKNTMLHFLDGRCAAVIGTHTKVISADERVTEKGTAYISDNGRVGSYMSVSGFDPETEIEKLKMGIPIRSKECWNDGVIQGVCVSVDEITGEAVDIEAFIEHVEIQNPKEQENV